MIGKTIADRYRVLRALGGGAFGAVYECEDRTTGRHVALKTIGMREPTSPDPSTYEREEETIARFRREAKAAGKIDSPHVVHLLDAGENDDTGLYMVLELLVGEDLGKRLARGPIEPRQAATWAREIALGLADAHAAGVVHRDLKPANVFLSASEGASPADVGRDAERVAKIVDFGTSKVSGQRDAITRAGTTLGTPQYMAPEQISGGTMDQRVDVWSLGAVLYEMLAGRPAYPLLASIEATFLGIATGKPQRLAKVAPQTPKALVAVVEGAMEHDLATRIPNAQKLAEEIANAIAVSFDSAPRVSGAPSREPSREPMVIDDAGSSGLVRAVVVIAILLVVGAAAAVAWTMR